MPTLDQVLGAVQGEISSVTQSVVSLDIPLGVMVGIGWPPVRALQQNVRGGSAVVTVYDRKMTSNSTRWSPTQLGTVSTTPGVVATLSPGAPLNSSIALPASGSIALTLSGSPIAADSISLVVKYGLTSSAIVYTATPSDTLTTIAAGIAAAVIASTALSSTVSVTASGPVLTITSLLPAAAVVSSLVGNVGYSVTEVGRRLRQIQIVIWASREEDRDAVGTAIESLLSQIETYIGSYQSGLVFSDGTSGVLKVVSDFYIDDAVLSDTYRRDFLISVDHPVTVTDELYAVLALISAVQPG